MSKRIISKELALYRKLVPVAQKLIVRMGNLRCAGHGEFTYMVRRVLGDIIEPWGLVTMKKEELFSLQEEKQAESVAGSLR